jgi:hypothetical protein
MTKPLWSIAFERLNLGVCKNLEEGTMFEVDSFHFSKSCKDIEVDSFHFSKSYRDIEVDSFHFSKSCRNIEDDSFHFSKSCRYILHSIYFWQLRSAL